MCWQFALVVAATLAIAVHGKTLDESASTNFQLVATETGLCLQPQLNIGYFTNCRDSTGKFTEFTVFYTTGKPGNNCIHIQGSKELCVDREHCHSGSSNLRYSSCSHCGAVHWDIQSGGRVYEDGQKNCIYSESANIAAVHHCSNGYTPFQQKYISSGPNDQALLKIYNDQMHDVLAKMKDEEKEL